MRGLRAQGVITPLNFFDEEREDDILQPLALRVWWYACVNVGCVSAELVRTIALKRDADGSPAAYYISKGTGSGANTWLVYLEVGADGHACAGSRKRPWGHVH